MSVAVVGGTGMLGRPLAAELVARGEQVRVLSRRPPAEPVAGTTHHVVDLADGSGLDGALAGVDVVVDVANDRSRAAAMVLVDGSRRLLAAGARAGIGHHVCVSIVGVEHIPLGYHRAKVRQEAVVAGGAVPWTILVATQVHELLDELFRATARWAVLPATRGVLLQPIDAAEVARATAEVAAASPRRERVSVAGPEVTELRDLVDAWRTARRSRAVPVPMPLPPRLGRELRDGALTDPAAARPQSAGFDEWLAGG